MLMQVPTRVPSRAPTRLPCSQPRAWGRAALWVLTERSSRSPAAKAPHRTLSPEGQLVINVHREGRPMRYLLARNKIGARRKVIGSAFVLCALLAVSACNSPSGADSGGTNSTINLGLITSVTGSLASTFGPDVVAGFNARVSAQNDAGGVNGRKIKVEVADDTSTPTGNLTAVQSLIGQNVFAVASWDAFMFASYKLLNQDGIPLLGGAFGSPAFGDPALTNQFSVFGPVDPRYPPYDSYGRLFKALGVTRLAALGYGTVPSSKLSAQAFAASAKAAGIDICYQDYGVPAGGVDFTPTALAIKNSGCNGVVAVFVESSELALATSLRDAGVNLKGMVSTQGYDQNTLNNPQARQAAQGLTVLSRMSPITSPNAGMKTMLHQLAEYAHSTGIPSFGEFGGWLTADALITGLNAAGKNPTRESFEKALRSVTDYTANGVLAGPTNFSLSKIGHGDSIMSGSLCWYPEKLTGATFESVSGSTPFCGSPVIGSN